MKVIEQLPREGGELYKRLSKLAIASQMVVVDRTR